MSVPKGVARRAGRRRPGFRILRAVTATRFGAARALILEYAASLEIDLNFQQFDRELAAFPGEYAEPHGALLLAYVGRRPVGVVALRKLGRGGCEMKRLYVQPRFRGRGIGGALARRIVGVAVSRGYSTMRLDTLASMREAIELYHHLGFVETTPYRFNPIRGARFMRLSLPPRPLDAHAR